MKKGRRNESPPENGAQKREDILYESEKSGGRDKEKIIDRCCKCHSRKN